MDGWMNGTREVEEKKRGGEARQSGVSERGGERRGEERRKTILISTSVLETLERDPCPRLMEAGDREYFVPIQSFASGLLARSTASSGSSWRLKILRGWAWRITCFALLCFALC